MSVLADLHVHSCASIDGRSSVADLIAEAKKRSLDAITISDHDCCTPLPEQQEILLIPGVEITTARGHILGLFLSRPIDFDRLGKYPAPASAIDAIHAAGGLAVLAHPFAPQKLTQDEVLSLPFDAIETANARAMLKKGANEKAAALAGLGKLPTTGGSDAHHASELGGCVTQFDCERTLSAMKMALSSGACRAKELRACRWVQKGRSRLRREKNCGTPASRMKALIYFCGCICRDVFHI